MQARPSPGALQTSMRLHPRLHSGSDAHRGCNPSVLRHACTLEAMCTGVAIYSSFHRACALEAARTQVAINSSFRRACALEAALIQAILKAARGDARCSTDSLLAFRKDRL